MLELLISCSKKKNGVLKILPKVQCAEIWVEPRRCTCPQISFTSPADSELHLSLSAVSHPGFSYLSGWLYIQELLSGNAIWELNSNVKLFTIGTGLLQFIKA